MCGFYSDVPTSDDIGKGIIVNCSSLARYVRVKKMSEDLQFCEMKVIGKCYLYKIIHKISGQGSCLYIFYDQGTVTGPNVVDFLIF